MFTTAALLQGLHHLYKDSTMQCTFRWHAAGTCGECGKLHSGKHLWCRCGNFT